MSLRHAILSAVLLALAAAPALADGDAPAPAELSADAKTLAEPLPVALTLKDKSALAGKLIAHDAARLKVQTDDGEKVIAWKDLAPRSVYATKRRLIDDGDAAARFDLGWYCWQNDMKVDGMAELAAARRLDPSLADKVEQVKAGTYKPEADADAGDGGDDESDKPATPGKPPEAGRAGGETDPKKVVKFSQPTPEQVAAALADIKRQAEETAKRLKVGLRLVETEHFFIFTDWPKADHKWLESVFEGMYRGLARQFGIDPKANIWYGKMPVYAFDDDDDFFRFVREIDGVAADPEMAGYAWAAGDGRGHIVIRKGGNRKQLSGLIVHEGTHAFLARYRSNMWVASWLNEGLAQMMVEIGVPNSGELRHARSESSRLARSGTDIRSIFQAQGNIPFSLYPAALTMTDLLIKRSSKKYVAMINDIKDGIKVEDALQKNYGWTFDELADLWTKWAKSNFKQ